MGMYGNCIYVLYVMYSCYGSSESSDSEDDFLIPFPWRCHGEQIGQRSRHSEEQRSRDSEVGIV